MQQGDMNRFTELVYKMKGVPPASSRFIRNELKKLLDHDPQKKFFEDRYNESISKARWRSAVVGCLMLGVLRTQNRTVRVVSGAVVGSIVFAGLFISYRADDLTEFRARDDYPLAREMRARFPEWGFDIEGK